MILTKQQKETGLIELVGTHDLALSMQRIYRAPMGSNNTVKRALYHACQMAGHLSFSELKALREVLGLP